MGFPYHRISCLVCGSSNLESLMWIATRGVPHGESGHKYVYDYTTMVMCTACGHAQMESYSHECWNPPWEEDWDMYWWYVLDRDSSDSLRSLLTSCPAPLDASCDCPIHNALRDSSDKAYGGILHVETPNARSRYTHLTLEMQSGAPAFVVQR
jgi:hypothetical protein